MAVAVCDKEGVCVGAKLVAEALGVAKAVEVGVERTVSEAVADGVGMSVSVGVGVLLG